MHLIKKYYSHIDNEYVSGGPSGSTTLSHHKYKTPTLPTMSSARVVGSEKKNMLNKVMSSRKSSEYEEHVSAEDDNIQPTRSVSKSASASVQEERLTHAQPKTSQASQSRYSKGSVHGRSKDKKDSDCDDPCDDSEPVCPRRKKCNKKGNSAIWFLFFLFFIVILIIAAGYWFMGRRGGASRMKGSGAIIGVVVLVIILLVLAMLFLGKKN